MKRRSSEDVVILKFDVASLSETVYKWCISEYHFRIGKTFGKEKKEYTLLSTLFCSRSAQENCFTHV